MDVNTLIRDALAACGGNQRELCRRTGLNQRTVNLWIRKKAAPSLESMVMLGKLCGVSAEDVVGYHLDRIEDGAKGT